MADLSTQGRGLSRAQRTRGPLVLVVTTLVSLIGGVSPDGDALAGRPIGDTVVFASVPDPGRPEGIAIGDGVVYVGTHTGAMGNAGEGPSKVFTYDLRSGERTGEILIEGQNLHATHGILAMTFGPDGRLYVVDRNPPRLIAIDLSADPPTQSTYATFPELHSCNSTPCPPGALDEPSFPDGVVFDPAGNAYVTDVQTGTIFGFLQTGASARSGFRTPGSTASSGRTASPLIPPARSSSSRFRARPARPLLGACTACQLSPSPGRTNSPGFTTTSSRAPSLMGSSSGARGSCT